MEAVILAAGKSSRFWPLAADRHKSLTPMLGTPLIARTLEALEACGIEGHVIVSSPSDRETFAEAFPHATVVVQEEPKGMGNALVQARDAVDGSFFVVNPDKYNIVPHVKAMQRKQTGTDADAVLLSTETETPWKYGVLELDGDIAHGLVEKPPKGEEPSRNKVCGLYLLDDSFFSFYEEIEEHEYAYEDALAAMMEEQDVRVVTAGKDLPSLKYAWDLFTHVETLCAEELTAEKADSATVASSAQIRGKVYIGENVTIHENAVIKGPCYIGDGSVIGNNALVRDHTVLEENVIVGTNAEVTRSIFLPGSSLHSGFVGDSIIGADTRIGAGFVTANRRLDRGEIRVEIPDKGMIETGKTALGCIIGSNGSVGVQSSVMPGTLIGKDCAIGPHTMVRNTLSDSVRCYVEQEQTVKEHA